MRHSLLKLLHNNNNKKTHLLKEVLFNSIFYRVLSMYASFTVTVLFPFLIAFAIRLLDSISTTLILWNLNKLQPLYML